MDRKHDVLARFVKILQPLCTVYKLPIISLQIFYDLRGVLIGFNRNASIFLNLRYYENWRESHWHIWECWFTVDVILFKDDKDVQKGNLSAAYVSWWVCRSFFIMSHSMSWVFFCPRFFTLAHEIAHNLVKAHDSEHGYYFSAICEAHIIEFGKLLNSTWDYLWVSRGLDDYRLCHYQPDCDTVQMYIMIVTIKYVDSLKGTMSMGC